MPRRREPADVAEATAVARALADDAAGRLERRVLEEVIYERLRLSVNLADLLMFEVELGAAVEQALGYRVQAPGERSHLVLDLVQKAWQRVSEEVLDQLVENELAERLEPEPEEDGADQDDDPQPRA